VETGWLVERSYLRSACREEGPGSDTGAMRTARDLPNDIDLRVVGCRARERLAGEGGSPDFLNLKFANTDTRYSAKQPDVLMPIGLSRPLANASARASSASATRRIAESERPALSATGTDTSKPGSESRTTLPMVSGPRGTPPTSTPNRAKFSLNRLIRARQQRRCRSTPTPRAPIR
jgi:hypothetical protein